MEQKAEEIIHLFRLFDAVRHSHEHTNATASQYRCPHHLR